MWVLFLFVLPVFCFFIAFLVVSLSDVDYRPCPGWSGKTTAFPAACLAHMPALLTR
jgi:hypothetical protein